MSWRRLGKIYAPAGDLPWERSHATLPTPIHIDGDMFRFFYSSRDEHQRSSIGSVDVRLDGEQFSVAGPPQLVLSFGARGSFDDSGVSIGSIERSEEGDRIYYMGWNLSQSVPWRNSIGVAIGNVEHTTFARLYNGPIMDRSPEDPYIVTYPWVMKIAEGDWRMWYGSHTHWGHQIAENHIIKMARSIDGLCWKRSNQPTITFAQIGEYTLSRPSVLKNADGWHMWFSTRGDRYTIGYATSQDGLIWRRDDARLGLVQSNDGWDSEMTCYPYAFMHLNRLYLAYNGNGYGRTGFGIAVWDTEQE